MFKPRLAKYLFWLSVLAILLISIKPGASSQLITGLDKFAHFISFFAITFLLLSAYRFNKPYLTSIILLAAFGLAIELVQYYLPYRIFSWVDFIADLIGILAGLVLFKILSPAQATA